MRSERGVATKWLVLVVILTVLSVVVPFFIWHSTWFGTPLSSAQMTRYLERKNHPQETQHALSQIADRIIAGDKSVARWYPDIARLSTSAVPQIRETAAWVMGQDNTSSLFHQTLLEMLRDPDSLVRMNAALGLVRFRDSSGHAIILQMLSGRPLLAPESGQLKRLVNVGVSLTSSSVVARIITTHGPIEVPAGQPGNLSQWVAADGATVTEGQPIAGIAPTSQMAWQALRALYLIGAPSDLNVIQPYARGVPNMPSQVAQQARLTMDEIRSRASD